MSDIQKARDVLAKWRGPLVSGAWYSVADGAPGYELGWDVMDNHGAFVGFTDAIQDARLIVGTAGNPDLLDAIDAVLAEASFDPRIVPERLLAHARYLSIAIVAADERMSA